MKLNSYIIYFTLILILLITILNKDYLIDTFSKKIISKCILISITLLATMYDYKAGFLMALIFIILNQNIVEGLLDDSVITFFVPNRPYSVRLFYEPKNTKDLYVLTQFQENSGHSINLVNNRFIKMSSLDTGLTVNIKDIKEYVQKESKVSYKYYTDEELAIRCKKRINKLNNINIIDSSLNALYNYSNRRVIKDKNAIKTWKWTSSKKLIDYENISRESNNTGTFNVLSDEPLTTAPGIDDEKQIPFRLNLHELTIDKRIPQTFSDNNYNVDYFLLRRGNTKLLFLNQNRKFDNINFWNTFDFYKSNGMKNENMTTIDNDNSVEIIFKNVGKKSSKIARNGDIITCKLAFRTRDGKKKWVKVIDDTYKYIDTPKVKKLDLNYYRNHKTIDDSKKISDDGIDFSNDEIPIFKYNINCEAIKPSSTENNKTPSDIITEYGYRNPDFQKEFWTSGRNTFNNFAFLHKQIAESNNGNRIFIPSHKDPNEIANCSFGIDNRSSNNKNECSVFSMNSRLVTKDKSLNDTSNKYNDYQQTNRQHRGDVSCNLNKKLPSNSKILYSKQPESDNYDLYNTDFNKNKIMYQILIGENKSWLEHAAGLLKIVKNMFTGEKKSSEVYEKVYCPNEKLRFKNNICGDITKDNKRPNFHDIYFYIDFGGQMYYTGKDKPKIPPMGIHTSDNYGVGQEHLVLSLDDYTVASAYEKYPHYEYIGLNIPLSNWTQSRDEYNRLHYFKSYYPPWKQYIVGYRWTNTRTEYYDSEYHKDFNGTTEDPRKPVKWFFIKVETSEDITTLEKLKAKIAVDIEDHADRSDIVRHEDIHNMGVFTSIDIIAVQKVYRSGDYIYKTLNETMLRYDGKIPRLRLWKLDKENFTFQIIQDTIGNAKYISHQQEYWDCFMGLPLNFKHAEESYKADTIYHPYVTLLRHHYDIFPREFSGESKNDCVNFTKNRMRYKLHSSNWPDDQWFYSGKSFQRNIGYVTPWPHRFGLESLYKGWLNPLFKGSNPHSYELGGAKHKNILKRPADTNGNFNTWNSDNDYYWTFPNEDKINNEGWYTEQLLEIKYFNGCGYPDSPLQFTFKVTNYLYSEKYKDCWQDYHTDYNINYEYKKWEYNNDMNIFQKKAFDTENCNLKNEKYIDGGDNNKLDKSKDNVNKLVNDFICHSEPDNECKYHKKRGVFDTEENEPSLLTDKKFKPNSSYNKNAEKYMDKVQKVITNTGKPVNYRRNYKEYNPELSNFYKNIEMTENESEASTIYVQVKTGGVRSSLKATIENIDCKWRWYNKCYYTKKFGRHYRSVKYAQRVGPFSECKRVFRSALDTCCPEGERPFIDNTNPKHPICCPEGEYPNKDYKDSNGNHKSGQTKCIPIPKRKIETFTNRNTNYYELNKQTFKNYNNESETNNYQEYLNKKYKKSKKSLIKPHFDNKTQLKYDDSSSYSLFNPQHEMMRPISSKNITSDYMKAPFDKDNEPVADLENKSLMGSILKLFGSYL